MTKSHAAYHPFRDAGEAARAAQEKARQEQAAAVYTPRPTNPQHEDMWEAGRCEECGHLWDVNGDCQTADCEAAEYDDNDD